MAVRAIALAVMLVVSSGSSDEGSFEVGFEYDGADSFCLTSGSMLKEPGDCYTMCSHARNPSGIEAFTFSKSNSRCCCKIAGWVRQASDQSTTSGSIDKVGDKPAVLGR
mmetsp:Transcript_34923/g.110976  ORF Transcript_34923/g.110976 Transcript_34923/m.110976 type:complete len:109 (-) Transcript_34923:221-547(-)